jgi:pimeloyl-ACP methyl ester carboxylesterase
MILKTAMVLALVLMLGWGLWTPDLDRSDLERQYARAGSQFVQTPGLRTHVHTDGPAQAPVVLLLHGFGSSLQTWDAWVQGLAVDHRVVRLDIAGFGLTGPAEPPDYSDEADVQRLLAVVDQLGLSRMTVVGHSMGGRLAWHFAAAHPSRVDKLVLIAPDGFPDPQAKSDKTYDVPAWMGVVRYTLPRWVIHQGVASAYADPSRLDDDTARRYQDMLLAPGVRPAVLARMAQTRNRDPLPWLQRLTMPTLLLWGEQDQMIPVANAMDYQRAIPHAQRLVMPGVGHLPHEEQPHRSLPLLRDFLQLPVVP